MANVAMADAGIASWDVKYEYDFWRPVTAIRDGANDGNANTAGNPTWTPLAVPASNKTGDGVNFTPPFPSYDSGHATFGGALFTTLAQFYGTDNVTFSISSDEFNGVTTDGAGQCSAAIAAAHVHQLQFGSRRKCSKPHLFGHPLGIR